MPRWWNRQTHGTQNAAPMAWEFESPSGHQILENQNLSVQIPRMSNAKGNVRGLPHLAKEKQPSLLTAVEHTWLGSHLDKGEILVDLNDPRDQNDVKRCEALEKKGVLRVVDRELDAFYMSYTYRLTTLGQKLLNEKQSAR